MMTKSVFWRVTRWMACAVSIFVTGGCKEPPDFELSPLDPGTNDFLFPIENVRVRSVATTYLIVEWTTRSTSVEEFVIDRGIDNESIVPFTRVSGNNRLLLDGTVSTSHTYTYRFTAIRFNASSKSVYITARWQNYWTN